MKRILLAFPLVAAGFMVAPHARAEGEAEQIAASFAAVAGSAENAVKLAKSLHSGKVVALRGTDANGNPSLVAFGVPEGGMSWSEVHSTLQKAQAKIQGSGIREASAHDIQAALLGGKLQRDDGSAVVVDGVLATRAPQAFTEPASASSNNGNPIYGATPSLPQASASTWGSYRPSIRKSQQFEHVAGVVNAGYLR
jgi:hypothetical protein